MLFLYPRFVLLYKAALLAISSRSASLIFVEIYVRNRVIEWRVDSFWWRRHFMRECDVGNTRDLYWPLANDSVIRPITQNF